MDKWLAILCIVIIRHVNSEKGSDNTEDKMDSKPNERPQVEVRAVFIKCETEEESNVSPESEAARFEREELFKHNVLRDCTKKLALTVKITTEPDSTGDEYIPVEHVFEGMESKRVRLLDPYILRLRRDPTLQAYKLRQIDTISGLVTNSEEPSSDDKYEESTVRIQRGLADLEHKIEGNPWVLEHEMSGDSPLIQGTQRLQSVLATTDFSVQESRKYGN